MNIREALKRGAETLARQVDVDDPKFESEVLLRYILNVDRAQLFLDLEKELDPEKNGLFDEWVKRRSFGEPVAYIIKCREFFGLDFYIDNRVLIPRPETELLVENAISYAKAYLTNHSSDKITIADIGTGSGVVAISVAANVPQARIYGTDISAPALEVAAINCRKHNVTDRVVLLEGDLLNPLPEPVDVLIANPPYVTHAELAQMPSARYEPSLALDGGIAGLDKIFRLGDQLNGKVVPGGCVLVEIGKGQDKEVVSRLQKSFPTSEIATVKDLAGIHRAVRLEYTGN